MYTNQDFSVRPPWNFVGQSPNPSYTPNYGMEVYQNSSYAVNATGAFANFTNIDTLGEGEKSLVTTLETRKNDEEMIENFLKENEHEFEIQTKNRISKTSSISEARNMLLSICTMNKELEKISEEIKKNRNMPETEWCAKIEATKSKRAKILETLGKLEEAEFIAKVITDIEKRKKKRLREKKLRASRKIDKLAATEWRTQLHAKADAWIKDKQDVIEKEKQVVSMRKEADIVLAEVRGKRSDARKFLALLQELRNLRRVQVNIAKGRGEHMSAAADETFTNIIDGLVEQWTAMDREYSIEEQGLKLMLKTDNEQKIEKQKRNIFNDWETVLFGRKLPAVDSFQRDIHAFVTMRAAWDKYINYDGLGSPIPIGWIMPDPPSSAAWQKYLKKE